MTLISWVSLHQVRKAVSEMHRMDGAALCLSLDSNSYEKHQWMFVAKMTFNF